MVEIIPAINVQTFEEVKKRVKVIETLGLKWAQFDIFNGIFTHLIGFNKPDRIKEIETSLNFEAHLMIWEPEHELKKWLKSGVKRIIFQYEATHKRMEIIKDIKDAGLEAGIALKPVTPWQFAEIFFNELDLVQILGVNPGPYGQKFQGEPIIRKIKTLKENYPKVKVEVDGGVNDKNAKEIIEAGADILVVGSYLFENRNSKEALKKLENIKI